MAEGVINGFGAGILEAYNSFLLLLPAWAQTFINLFLLVLLVVIYAVFVWKFYRFVSKKNIIELNLGKYSKAEHPVLAKLVAGGLYFIEYIIILPFLIFFWFAIFTLFLIFLTENLEVSTLLLISAVIIAAIRMTSYYSEDLSKEIAKLLPFMLLAISLLSPNFFNLERIFTHFNALPQFFGNIAYYLIFIIGLEIILRFFDFIFSLFGVEEEKVEGESKEEIKEGKKES